MLKREHRYLQKVKIQKKNIWTLAIVLKYEAVGSAPNFKHFFSSLNFSVPSLGKEQKFGTLLTLI